MKNRIWIISLSRSPVVVLLCSSNYKKHYWIKFDPKVEQVLRYKSPSAGDCRKKDKNLTSNYSKLLFACLMYRKVVYYSKSRSFTTLRSFTVQIWRLNVRGREVNFFFFPSCLLISGRKKQNTSFCVWKVKWKRLFICINKPNRQFEFMKIIQDDFLLLNFYGSSVSHSIGCICDCKIR